MNKLRMLSAISAATFCGFAIHVLYGQGWPTEYVARAAQAGRLEQIIHEPYPIYVMAVAFLSAAIPTLGKVFVYCWLHEKLPGRSPFVKGLWFGLLMLFIRDDMLRLPIMNLVVGNPFDVVLVQSLEAWLLYPLTGLLIALCIGQPRAAVNFD